MHNIGIAKRAGSAAATSGKPATDHSVARLGSAPREVTRMIGPTRVAECQKVADRYGARIYLYPDGSAFDTPQDRRGEPTLVEPALAPPDIDPETHGRFQIAAAAPFVGQGVS
jgi:hypothetical protein